MQWSSVAYRSVWLKVVRVSRGRVKKRDDRSSGAVVD